MDRTITDKLERKTNYKRLYLEKGNAITEQEGTERNFCKVISGTLKKTLKINNKPEQIIRFLDEEDIFETHPRPFSYGTIKVEAITPSELYNFDKETFEKEGGEGLLLLKDVQEAKQIELMKAQAHISMLGQETAREKVATFLLDRFSVWEQKELKKLNSAADEELYAYVPMKMHDVANYLGIKTETLSRSLTSFVSSGITSTKHRKHIRILDFYKLIDITTSGK